MASALETLCGQAYGAKQYHMLGIYLQRSWIILPLFFLHITSAASARSRPRNLPCRRLNLHLVHPSRFLQRVQFHIPDVPPVAKQEHGHLVFFSSICHAAYNPLMGVGHQVANGDNRCNDFNDYCHVDSRDWPVCICAGWRVSWYMEGFYVECVYWSLACYQAIFVFWRYDMVISKNKSKIKNLAFLLSIIE